MWYELIGWIFVLICVIIFKDKKFLKAIAIITTLVLIVDNIQHIIAKS